MADFFRTGNSVTEPLKADCLGNFYHLFIKRDDLIHPIVSGNKWRKLKFNIQKAQQENKNHIVTFGGAYSNHMVATACTGATLGIKTSCFIRGDELQNKSNHYLFAAQLYGMELIPVSREKYRNKTELFAEYFGNKTDVFYIAEGGESEDAYWGVEEIISEIKFVPDFILHASATGSTTIGLAKGLQKMGYELNETKILSIPILKNSEEQLQKFILNTVSEKIKLCIGYEFGGYAKTYPELIEFCKLFISQTGIMIDPVYTGKALWALKEMLKSGEIAADKKVLFLHTGGTLGIFSEKFIVNSQL